MGLYPALFIQQSSSPVTMVISLLSLVSRLQGGRCAGGDQGQLSWGWRTAGRGALPLFSPHLFLCFSLPIAYSFPCFSPSSSPGTPLASPSNCAHLLFWGFI